MNSFSRLCLHTLVRQDFPQLLTFSVGLEKDRRPVVCHQLTVAETIQADATFLANRKVDNEVQEKEKTKRNQKRPDRPFYVPPGSKQRNQPGDIQRNELGKKANRATSNIFNKDVPVEAEEGYLTEIRTILGYVKIVTPFNNYPEIEQGCFTGEDIMNHDLPNVVEMFDFPKEFKTDDLESCLHRHLELVHYYDLKWVDDTHALVLFAEEATANLALNILDPCVKLRPFWAASKQSFEKARVLNLTTESTGTKSRPKTSVVTANRILARALGLSTSSDQKPHAQISKRSSGSK